MGENGSIFPRPKGFRAGCAHIEEAPDGMPGLLPLSLKERHGGGRETITTALNYHLEGIKQPWGKPISLPLDAMAAA